ncbi:MAG: tetratricopeptide repeat protein [Bacteroidota bacterium]
MNKYFSNNIVFVCWFCIVFNAGITAQSIDGTVNNTTKQENLLDQIADEGNSIESIRKYYEAILKTDSTDYDALTNLGVIHQRFGDEEKSLQYFKNAVKFHPQRARAFHNLGILYGLIGKLDEAVINLNKAAELDTRSPNSVRQLGIIYLQNEKYNEAIESFNRALSREKLDIESYLGKAIAYWSLKDYDKVISEINKMQSLGLRFNRMELLLADVYFKKKDYEKAMEYAKIDESENSSKPEGHYLLGVLYKIDGENEKAENEFEEANKITQQNPTAQLELNINIFFSAKVK